MRPDRRLLLGFTAFWLACAVLAMLAFNVSISLGTVRFTEPTSTWRRVSMQVGPWLAVLLLTPAVLAICRWMPATRSTWKRVAAIHAGAVPVFALSYAWLSICAAFLMRFELPRWPTPTELAARIAATGMVALTEYALIVGTAEAFRNAREARDRAAQAEMLARQSAELERDLADAKLAALRQQLQPHFVFNALNAVTSLIDERPADAQRLVTRLSELLRLSLNRGASIEVSLGEELDLTDRYVAVERARFGDRLDVHYDIEEASLGAQVPSFILQPLVENAVRHGVGRRSAGGTVTIAARRVGGRLHLSIRNELPDTVPHPTRPKGASGLGLPQTRARLHSLYGGGASCSARQDDSGNFLVTLLLPWRLADGAART